MPSDGVSFAAAAAPAGRSLVPGQFPAAGNWPTQPPQSPGLMLAGNGRACGYAGGEFTVNEAQFAPDGSVIRFAASFAQRYVNFIEEPRLSTVPWLRGTVPLTNPPKILMPNLPCR